MRSRFLNISYLLNTVVIKTRALWLKTTRGVYPYDYFKSRIQPISAVSYSLQYNNQYHSLAYLNYQKAINLHSGDRSITQDLIIGLVYYNELIANKKSDKKFLIDLANQLKDKAEYSENSMIFYFNKAYSRFDLDGRYASGIVQGKAASFFLRCHLLTNEGRYKQWAKNCLISAWKSIDEGGVLRKLDQNQFWVEEYPSSKPSMVLNGFLFYIIGLAEYLSIEDDVELEYQLDECLKSLLTWMPNYRVNKGLLYSMYRWNLCNVHYTGIMKYQFEHLYQLTENPIFNEYAEFTNKLTDWKTFESII